MRQLEGFQSFLDNYGDPLVGRLRFYDKTTSAEANVYDSEGTSLGSVVYTDTAGRLANQVFLADRVNYLVLVDKFVGTGAMVIDEGLSGAEAYQANEELEAEYLNIGSFINLYDTLNIHIDTEGVQCFATMAAMRAIEDPREIANGVLCLLGYNSAGDKPLVYYKWDENSTEADNGGTIIEPDEWVGSGRWIMLSGDILDSRDFGIIPLTTPGVMDSAMRAKVMAFINAAVVDDTHVKKLYFAQGSTGNAWYYDISSNFYIAHAMSANNVMLVAEYGEHSITITDCDKSVVVYQSMVNEETQQGVNLRSRYIFNNTDTLYTSQHKSASKAIGQYYCDVSFSPSSRMVFDNSDFSGDISLEGKYCLFTSLTNVELSLTRCSIVSNGKIQATSDKEVTLDHCVVDEGYFSANSLDYLTFTDCTLGNWATFEFAQKVSSSIDGSGFTVEDDVILESGFYKNLVFSGDVTMSAAGSFVFENCVFSGSLLDANTSTPSQMTCVVMLNNCTITGMLYAGTITANSCTVSGITMGYSVLKLYNSTFGILMTSNTIVASNVSCSHVQCVTTGVDNIAYTLNNFTCGTYNSTGIISNSPASQSGDAFNVYGGSVGATETDLGIKGVSGSIDLTSQDVYLKTNLVTRTLKSVHDMPTKTVRGTTYYYFNNSFNTTKGEEVEVVYDTRTPLSTPAATYKVLLWWSYFENIYETSGGDLNAWVYAYVEMNPHQVKKFICGDVAMKKYCAGDSSQSLKSGWSSASGMTPWVDYSPGTWGTEDLNVKYAFVYDT